MWSSGSILKEANGWDALNWEATVFGSTKVGTVDPCVHYTRRAIYYVLMFRDVEMLV